MEVRAVLDRAIPAGVRRRANARAINNRGLTGWTARDQLRQEARLLFDRVSRGLVPIEIRDPKEYALAAGPVKIPEIKNEDLPARTGAMMRIGLFKTTRYVAYHTSRLFIARDREKKVLKGATIARIAGVGICLASLPFLFISGPLFTSAMFIAVSLAVGLALATGKRTAIDTAKLFYNEKKLAAKYKELEALHEIREEEGSNWRLRARIYWLDKLVVFFSPLLGFDWIPGYHIVPHTPGNPAGDKITQGNCLGSGGMGEVYQIYDPTNKCFRAIKILLD
ncbi:hypothetical protein ACFL5U_03655, partial [Candidatus Margulisiibacteriota bacterium]